MNTTNLESMIASRDAELPEDFKLDSYEFKADDDSKRIKVYESVVVYLTGFMSIKETAGCASILMSEWDEDLELIMQIEGETFLFYREHEITCQSGQWMFENENNQDRIFDVSLLNGLRVINEVAE